MALSDIISIPFLISLGITLLLVGLIGVFFSQRLQEQNHKIESMFGIISTMAEEMNYMREKIQGGRTHNESKKEDKKTATDSENVLIDVSDDSSDDSDSDDSDSDDSSDCDDDDGDDDDSSITENKILNCIKVINFGESLTISEKIDAESMSDSDDLDGDDLDGDDLDELDDLEELDNKKISEDTTLLNSNSFKSINISNLEETKEFESLDYKKMSLNKLRSISLSKGLDASKLKKTDILKLLGLEC